MGEKEEEVVVVVVGGDAEVSHGLVAQLVLLERAQSGRGRRGRGRGESAVGGW